MYYYHYELLLREGGATSGVAVTPQADRFAARHWIESRYRGVVVKLRALPQWCGWCYLRLERLVRSRVAPKDMIALLRDLSLMVNAGIPIMESLVVLRDATEQKQKALRRCVRELAYSLEAGTSVGEAFGEQPHVFPETVRSLVTIGDETGSLERMLAEAAEHLERLSSLKADARQALIYPAFVFASIFGAAWFWIYFVIPRLSGLFRQMNVKLPALTLAVIAVSDFCQKYALVILIALSLMVLSLSLAWRTSKPFRRGVLRALRHLPVSGTIVESSGLAFFSEYLHLLISAGLDVVRSFEILERTLANQYYGAYIGRMRVHIQNGERISSAMKAVGSFPPMVVRVVLVGENSGSLERQLAHLAREYRTRMGRVINALSETIRPVIILVAGAFFIVIIMALLLPVYDLVRHAMHSQY